MFGTCNLPTRKPDKVERKYNTNTERCTRNKPIENTWIRREPSDKLQYCLKNFLMGL